MLQQHNIVLNNVITTLRINIFGADISSLLQYRWNIVAIFAMFLLVCTARVTKIKSKKFELNGAKYIFCILTQGTC